MIKRIPWTVIVSSPLSGKTFVKQITAPRKLPTGYFTINSYFSDWTTIIEPSDYTLIVAIKGNHKEALYLPGVKK